MPAGLQRLTTLHPGQSILPNSSDLTSNTRGAWRRRRRRAAALKSWWRSLPKGTAKMVLAPSPRHPLSSIQNNHPWGTAQKWSSPPKTQHPSVSTPASGSPEKTRFWMDGLDSRHEESELHDSFFPPPISLWWTLFLKTCLSLWEADYKLTECLVFSTV